MAKKKQAAPVAPEPTPIDLDAIMTRDGQGYGAIPGIDYDAGQMEISEAQLAEFSALLPGPYYMDPPDGGSVTVLEQFRRMALDAQRWRAQQEWISKAIACELRCEGGGDEILDGRNPNPPECDPRA